MAKKMYVGINDIARKITNAYVGVNGVARKIVKGYVGVNGIAQQIYETKQAILIPFTSNPAPTSWGSDTTTTANYEFKSSNTYGEWRVSGDVTAYNTSRVARCGVDNSDSSFYQPSASAVLPGLTVFMPTNIKICPNSFRYRTQYMAFEIQGLSAGNSWETIYTLSTSSTSILSGTVSVNTTTYYKAFRLKGITSTSTSRKRIYDFNVVSGTIKDER